MSNNYAYIRVSPKIADIEQRVESFTEMDSTTTVIKETNIRGKIDLNERPAYQSLRKQLKSGDSLLVWWIDELGCDIKRCLTHLSTLLDDGISVKTVKQRLEFKPDDIASEAMLRLMAGYAEMEECHRLAAAEFGRRALKENPEMWKEKFRGRRRDTEQHQAIAQALLEGKTLQAVAEETGSSLSTIKRVKSKLRDGDDLGQLRTRGSGNGKGHGHGGRHGHGDGRGRGKGMRGRGQGVDAE